MYESRRQHAMKRQRGARGRWVSRKPTTNSSSASVAKKVTMSSNKQPQKSSTAVPAPVMSGYVITSSAVTPQQVSWKVWPCVTSSQSSRPPVALQTRLHLQMSQAASQPHLPDFQQRQQSGRATRLHVKPPKSSDPLESLANQYNDALQPKLSLRRMLQPENAQPPQRAPLQLVLLMTSA